MAFRAVLFLLAVVVQSVIDCSAFFLRGERGHTRKRAGPGALADWRCHERVDVGKVRAQRQRREWVGEHGVGEQRSWRPQRSELREAQGPALSFGPSSLGRVPG